MRMSTKGRFAVNALIDLALRQGSGPVALATISARQQVSLSYLEQLFSRLRRDGIVESTRGPGGGYTLARELQAITVADVVNAVEDAADNAEHAADGLSRALWQRLNTQLLQYMATITLKQLLEELQAQGVVADAPAPRRAVAARPVVKALRSAVPNSVFAFGKSFAR
jgi:Rrf2 family iron-sulfur cluster assembly transcriptional regulator